MKAAKVVGRVISTAKYPTLKGKKILLLKPLSWEQAGRILSDGGDETPDSERSLIALDAVGAGSSEYVFYVSSKEACQAFEDAPVCHNAVVGIIDGVSVD